MLRGQNGEHPARTAGKGSDPMTYLARWAPAVACSAVLLAQVANAQACSCPKEQPAQDYGTVSQLPSPLPLPPPLPPAKRGAPANG